MIPKLKPPSQGHPFITLAKFPGLGTSLPNVPYTRPDTFESFKYYDCFKAKTPLSANVINRSPLMSCFYTPSPVFQPLSPLSLLPGRARATTRGLLDVFSASNLIPRLSLPTQINAPIRPSDTRWEMAGIKTGAHLYLSAAGHVDTVCLSRSLFGESVEVPNVHYKVIEWSEPGHPKRS